MNLKRLLRRSKVCSKKLERKFFRIGKNIFELKDGEYVETSMAEFFDYVNTMVDSFSETTATIYAILIGIWGTIIVAVILALISVLK